MQRRLGLFIRIGFLALFLLLMFTGRFQLWLMIYIVGVVLSPFFGRIYCGYVCPMNTVMRPVQKFSRKIGLQRKCTPAWLESPKLPFLTLALSLLAMVMAKSTAGVQLPILPILFGLSIVVTLFFKSPVWHNGLCPYSILLRWGGKFARRSRTVDHDLCVGTRHCTKVCPSGAITVSEGTHKANIDPALCHQCEACASVCPKMAISYRKHT